MINQQYWGELEKKAAEFSVEYAIEDDEKGEAKTFWDDFFRDIFDIRRRRLGKFEEGVIKGNTKGRGFIDFLWRGKLLVEHKSAEKNSEKDFHKAYEQAIDYVKGLPLIDRPKYIVICNFKRFQLHSLEQRKVEEFLLQDLRGNIKKFDFIIDFYQQAQQEEEKVNIDAALLMSLLHRQIKATGYDGRDLELLLVRLLFCLFAEDTGIFTPKLFGKFLLEHQHNGGKGLGKDLLVLFKILNTHENDRPNSTPKYLNDFPYINGGLFAEPLKTIPQFSLEAYSELYKLSSKTDWSEISPAIFGSLFQDVLNDTDRRSLGAHYTSEKNIRRLINPLFMDALQAEFKTVKSNRKELEKFYQKICTLKFFDPACGCGNFLVVAYKELRLLELEVLLVLFDRHYYVMQNMTLKVSSFRKRGVQLEHFYGIEIEESSALIAQTAMWLTDHQCNRQLEKTFLGEKFLSIPLTKGAAIRFDNSLRTDWEKTFPDANFIVGNPPFIGKHLQNDAQKADIELIFKGIQGSGNLDYVTAWYLKAAQYMKANPSVKTAFVSTNSIVQGEQVGVLWKELFETYKVKILFAHQTFKWNNEASGVAAVHCIIVGFALNTDGVQKAIFEYEDIKGEPIKTDVKNINPYLVESKDLWIESRTNPICNVPKMMYGSKPVDNGHLFFTDDEKDEFLRKEPKARKFIRPILSGDEFINGKNRWCLWLVNADPKELKALPLVMRRIEGVAEYRSQSTKKQTRDAANTPSVFAELRQPTTNFLLIPRTSSENRAYIPFGFFPPEYIVSDSCTALPNADLFLFGMLTSKMHMAWVKYVCGRLKSDYRYSNLIVYNNYPFPQNVSDAQRKAVEKAAQSVLNERNNSEGKSLAFLYDPLSMPLDLLESHNDLDKAVDSCYGKTRFRSDAIRVAYLFDRYAELIKAENETVKKKK